MFTSINRQPNEEEESAFTCFRLLNRLMMTDTLRRTRALGDRMDKMHRPSRPRLATGPVS